METKKDTLVFGMFLRREDVRSAVATLEEAKFAAADISVLLPEKAEAAESKDLIADCHTKAPEGTAVGASSGAAVGCTLGWLVGAGALILPGIGPVVAAGPIVAALAGLGIGGALGGFAGSLIGVGMSETDAQTYEGRLKTGGILLAVHCDCADRAQQAEKILKARGAADISFSTEPRLAPQTQGGATAA